VTSVLPSELLVVALCGVKFGWVTVDTETSGLFVDDGARVSTVSVAWQTGKDRPGHEIFKQWADEGRVTLQTENIDGENWVDICSVAWPFDQGKEGKPEDNGQISLFDDEPNLDLDEWKALLDFLVLVGNGRSLGMHHAKFDVTMLNAGCRRWPGVGVDLMEYVGWDTQNVCDLLWGWEKTSLKPTCQRLFGKAWADESDKVHSYLKAAKLPPGRWDLVPWDVIGPYADTDARITLMLLLRQMAEIHLGGGGDWFGHQQAVHQAVDRRLTTTNVLKRMEWKGIPFDQVGAQLAGDECMVRAAKIADTLPFKPATEHRAKRYWFGELDEGGLGLVPYAVSEETGTPSIAAEVVDRMVADDVPHARTWAQFQKVSNAASMWYHGYSNRMGSDGRLRTSFRQNGARSSRFSSERINLQAIPADYKLSGYASLEGIPTPRQLIAAGVPDGWGIWELDLAQAELRVGALYSKCGRMLDMMASGEDMHTFTTQELFQVGPGDGNFSQMRQVGKKGNFSLGFDSGPDTFMKMVAKDAGIYLTLEESSDIVRGWRSLYPEWHEAVLDHMRVVERRQRKYGKGWVECNNGERRWWQRWEDAHKAFNQRVQTSLAQFGIDWMIATDNYLSQFDILEANGGGLILTIHDSQVLLLPLDGGQAMADQCAKFAGDLWKQWFPGVDGYSEAKAWKAA
jgi:hypothetical protein